MRVILFALMQQLLQALILICLIICQIRSCRLNFLCIFSEVPNMFVTTVSTNNLDGEHLGKQH